MSFYVATWNIQSLVKDFGGDRRICQGRPQTRHTASENCKFDLLVQVLSQYKVGIAAIQETRWFGSDIWDIPYRTQDNHF